MNKNKLLLPAVCILLLSGLFAVANNYHWLGLNTDHKADLPDAKEELRKIYARYNDPAASLNMKGTIRLFDRENKDVLKEQTAFDYSKQASGFYSQIGYLQTFFSGNMLVQLDTVNKYIIVSKVDNESVPVSAPAGLPFEKFMHDTSTFKIEATIAEKNSERYLVIKNELNPEIKLSTIYYDPVTYVIKRAEIEWWKEAVVYDNADDRKKVWLTVMEYTYPVSTGLSVADRIKKIVVLKDGKIEPAPAYRDYEVQSSF